MNPISAKIFTCWDLFLKLTTAGCKNIYENTLWSLSFTFLHAECEKSIFRQKWALELTGHGLQGFSVFSNSWHVSSWFVQRRCGKVSIEIHSSYGLQSKGGHFYLTESYRNISPAFKSCGILAPARLLLLQLLCELRKEHRLEWRLGFQLPEITLRWQRQLRCFKCLRKRAFMLTAEAFAVPSKFYKLRPGQNVCFRLVFPDSCGATLPSLNLLQGSA